MSCSRYSRVMAVSGNGRLAAGWWQACYGLLLTSGRPAASRRSELVEAGQKSLALPAGNRYPVIIDFSQHLGPVIPES